MNLGVARVRAHDLAEDALQEALSKVITQSSVRFSNFKEFERFTIRCAINHAIDMLRKVRRERHMPDGYDRPGEPAKGVRACLWLVCDCLKQLPEEERRLLERYLYEGLSLDELAVAFLPPDGREPNARRLVIFRWRRAILERLRNLLLERGLDPSDWTVNP
jgi:RNA polymerase sigma factor (sigma-70 family)